MGQGETAARWRARRHRSGAGAGLTGLVVAAMIGLGSPAAALAAEDPPEPGQTTTASFAYGGGTYSFIRYVPQSLKPGTRVPLVVMIHGAQTTALQELHATGYDRVAEREGFIVLYPDTDELGSNAPGPIAHSWKFYDPTTYFRGNGDAAAIAAMTRKAIADLPVDPERVYAVGTSVGGLMADVEAAAYPEIFTAAANVESAAYADPFCFVTGTGIPVQTSAQLAYAQLQPRARVVPTMVMTSDGDQAFPAACGKKALQQGLRMNNLVLSGSQDKPLALTPASVRNEQVPDGYKYDVGSYRDAGGCVVAEQWLIHGMPHSWPGGPTIDPKYTGYTDKKAPSGAEATWAFVSRYRKSDTGGRCAETAETAPGTTPATTVPGAAASTSVTAPTTGRNAGRCPARSVTLQLPPGAKARFLTLDGRRVSFTRARGTVRLRLPAATRKARAKLVLAIRAKSGRSLTHRRTVTRC